MSSKRILLIASNKEIIKYLYSFLKIHEYEILLFDSLDKAFSALNSQADLVLIEEDNFKREYLCQCDELRTRLFSIPLIALTKKKKDESVLLEMGANDVITLPSHPDTFIARIKNQIRIKKLMDEMEKVENILFSITKIVEARDPYTKGHSHRVTSYACEIGIHLGLKRQELDVLKKGALLHDIGKVAIPDAILRKRGSLSQKEEEVMKQHPKLGYRICKPLTTMNGALDIILHHHERWDGSGYPEGLKGEKIPFLARIVAVVDTFDALCSNRTYRKPIEKKKALKFIEKGAGTLFDPQIVEAFLKVENAKS